MYRKGKGGRFQMSEKVELLFETIELTQEINKNLALSEYLLNDGEVAESKNVLNRGISTLKTCVKDCFKEIEEEFNFEAESVDEDPSVCNLIACISDFANALLMLLKLEIKANEQMLEIAKNKAKVSLGKVYDLTNKLFD